MASSPRGSSAMGGDKRAELSPATAPAPPSASPPVAARAAAPTTATSSAVAAVAKFHRLVRGGGAAAEPATTPEQDAQALIQSFRRKKNLRARLLLPLQGDDHASSATSASSPRVQAPPPRAHRRVITPRKPLSRETQSVLARLPPDDANNNLRDEQENPEEEEITALARVHALLASGDEIDRWIATYETERAQFASFALFTETKLDEIRDRYVLRAGRPNAVEAAACCATLLKMPGIVGCYATLLGKLARGVLSVVYVPEPESPSYQDDAPMAALVRACFARPTYFQRARELERQVREARSLTDPRVLRALTVDEITRMVRQVPVRTMCEGVVAAYATHLPHLDHLLARIDDKKLQLQLEFYRLHGHRRRRLAKRNSAATDAGDNEDGDDDDDDDDLDDPNYPLAVPLSSSAQICRAITQHAATFSSSGKEMILCSILEHIEVESFKDVFKRFDAHGKTCFLHHLSALESSDHLQLILEQLPNPGDTLFRFYYVICGGGGSGRVEESGRPDPKHAFFQKLLGAEMEFFFLCDLAVYLNDDQWTLLSQEYEKNAQARKARRRRQRRRLAAGEAGAEVEDDGKEGEDGEDAEDGDDDLFESVTSPARSSGSMEQFQTMVWNYIRQHKSTSAQIWALMQAVLMPSLEETEAVACLDHCIDRLQLAARWRKMLALLEELEGDGTNGSSPTADTDLALIREVRLQMLKKLLGMLSHEDRTVWVDKTAAKFGTPKPQPPPAARNDPAPPVTIMQAPPKPLSLDDPTPHIALMRMDTKMLWLEALLNAVANDKETSARTMMLKQTLLPFLNGQTPAPVQPAPTAMALTYEEKAIQEKPIQEIIVQLKQENPADEAALGQKIVPENLRPKVKATSDRSVSPIPELIPKAPPPLPVEPVKTWWEAAGPDSEVAKAFRALLETKPEAEVLELLRRGEVPKAVAIDKDVEVKMEKQGSLALRSSVKRKVSAIVAVAQPIEWQEYVKVGMLDQGTQTDLALTSDTDQTPAEKPAPIVRVPLTLSSLLGRGPNEKSSLGGATPRRKGDGKFQKLNNTAVPRSISGLITSWRVNTDQLAQFAKKSMPTVLRLIADAYGELLTAGRRKANFQATVAGTATNPRGAAKELTLAQVVYQQFLHSYGLPGIADMHLLALSCALDAYRPQHLRVEFFSRFVFEEVPKLELSNYLEFLECLVSDDPAAGSTTNNVTGSGGNASTNSSSGSAAGPVSTKRQRFVARIVVSDKENWMVPLEKAQEAAQLCFRAMRKQAVTAFCDKLATIAGQGTGGYVSGGSGVSAASSALAPAMSLSDSGRTSPSGFSSTTSTVPATTTTLADGLMLNVDFLLRLVVDEWREEQLRREVHLLNVFRTGDVNGDGELTSAEFTQIVLAIDHTRDLGDVLLMYSETLRRTQCDAIDADTFLQIAKEYELDRAAWNEDGDLRNVVNNMNELQETWVHTRPFFLGTLEALVRDLPTVHFLRVCEGAGCGCLKCILDGYIGFQRMRREFFSTANPRVALVPSGQHRATAVSEALLWARFWHLMRQLYEAASESPGILTAWEDANYMRVHAAPRPPPRFLKYRRMALPNFLFPDTARISGKVSTPYEQGPEVYDRDGIQKQFAKLLELMSHAPGGKSAISANADGANPQ